MKSDLIDVIVIVKHTTERAVLVTDGTRQAWLPLSQVEVAANEDGRTHTLTLPEWLAHERGLI
jgi:hypothetical protein